MFRIGEFSKLAKTTVKTIRYYDEVGLLKPVFVDGNGYRYYETEQLNDLIKIIELRNLDVPIVDIKKILNSLSKDKLLEKHLLVLENNLDKTKNQITLLKKYIAKAKEGDFMEKYQAKEIVVEESIVYFRHGTIASMHDLFTFVLEAGAEARKLNPTIECKNYCYVTYTAKEYKENDVELEYVETVKEFGNESFNIKFRKDPKIKAISVEHKGSYSNLPKAYSYAIEYVKEKGYKICGPIREVYVHGCWDEEVEDNYLTEIQIPIAK